MNRREFFNLGLAPFLLSTSVTATNNISAPVASMANQPAEPLSRLAKNGFLPNVPLVTHRNQNVRFYDDLVREKTVLINFFLIQCSEGRCPLAMANLRQVQNMLGSRMGKDVFFLSITLQPLLNTPQALNKYAEIFKPKPGWDLLTGKPEDVETLRRTLGFADADPELDNDLQNHTSLARYGNDKLERWGMVSLRSSPNNIASTFKWLTV